MLEHLALVTAALYLFWVASGVAAWLMGRRISSGEDERSRHRF